MLTAKNGMTLYIFDKDKGGVSSCYDQCATNWPPYLGKEGDAMEKDWALAKRTDGTMQWTYDGKPVYFFKDDKKAGDAKGDGKGNGRWHVVNEDCNLQGFSDHLGMPGEKRRVRHLAGMGAKFDAFHSGHDMEVEMKHRLPGGRLIVLLDQNTIGREGLLRRDG